MGRSWTACIFIKGKGKYTEVDGINYVVCVCVVFSFA